MGQEINMTEAQYAIESNNLLKEINSIDKNNLSIQLLILEDTENELLDEYRGSQSLDNYILEVWRTKIRIDCIRQRMNMYENEIDGLLSQLSNLGLEK